MKMFEHRTTRSTVFWAIAALAFISQTIVSAIIIRLASITFASTHHYGTALAASVLDISGLALLLVAIGFRRLSLARVALTAIYALASIVGFVAAVLSVYLLAWTLQHEGRQSSRALASAGAAFWTLAVVAEGGFFAYLLWPQRRLESDPPFEVTIDRPSPVRSVKRSLSVHLTSLTPTPPRFGRSRTEPYSPADSGYASSPRSSLRESMGQALRPMGSKTRLLRRSFMSGDSPSLYSARRTSLETVRQCDGFETWDTSAVEERYSESPTLHKSRLRLDPIPGSRPVSPAKPLDGPFPEDISPEQTPLPESPSHSPLASPSAETSSLRGMQMPPLRRPSYNQSHIHPLFRPESPMPPPIASPSTVITASPFAGQIVSSEHAMSPMLFQGSRPGSAPPMSPLGSRPGSVKSFRTQAASPLEPPLTSPLHESVVQSGS